MLFFVPDELRTSTRSPLEIYDDPLNITSTEDSVFQHASLHPQHC